LRSTIFGFFIAAGVAASLHAQTVRFYFSEGGTPSGTIDVALRPDVAPLSVANFLAYISAGAYVNTIIHRSVPPQQGFGIVQGGGYQLINGTMVAATQNAAVPNEFNLSNVKGTIAMALPSDGLGNTNINGATNEWFFNATNNSLSLDSQSFAVFGSITAITGSPAGLTTMAALNNLPVFTESIPVTTSGVITATTFADIPLVNNYMDLTTVEPNNYVTVTSIVVLPVTTELSVVNAASSTQSLYNGISPGELLTIYGTSLGPGTCSATAPTGGVSFASGSNPIGTTLGNTQVLFNGVPGPMLYSQCGQVNVIVPYEVAGSSSVNVVIQYQGVPSGTLAFNVVPAVPGIFPNAIVDNNTGAVISATNPAFVGEVLALYGTGQGVQTPAVADGALVGSSQPYTIPLTPTTLLIDGQPVQPVYYAGGAPGEVAGVLQVDFQVPQLAPGNHSIQIQSGTGSNAVLSATGYVLQTR